MYFEEFTVKRGSLKIVLMKAETRWSYKKDGAQVLFN